MFKTFISQLKEKIELKATLKRLEREEKLDALRYQVDRKAEKLIEKRESIDNGTIIDADSWWEDSGPAKSLIETAEEIENQKSMTMKQGRYLEDPRTLSLPILKKKYATTSAKDTIDRSKIRIPVPIYDYNLLERAGGSIEMRDKLSTSFFISSVKITFEGETKWIHGLNEKLSGSFMSIIELEDDDGVKLTEDIIIGTIDYYCGLITIASSGLVEEVIISGEIIEQDEKSFSMPFNGLYTELSTMSKYNNYTIREFMPTVGEYYINGFMDFVDVDSDTVLFNADTLSYDLFVSKGVKEVSLSNGGTFYIMITSIDSNPEKFDIEIYTNMKANESRGSQFLIRKDVKRQ